MKCTQPATVEVYADGQLKTMLCQQHEDQRKQHSAEHAAAVAAGTRPPRRNRPRQQDIKPGGQRGPYDF